MQTADIRKAACVPHDSRLLPNAPMCHRRARRRTRIATRPQARAWPSALRPPTMQPHARQGSSKTSRQACRTPLRHSHRSVIAPARQAPPSKRRRLRSARRAARAHRRFPTAGVRASARKCPHPQSPSRPKRCESCARIGHRRRNPPTRAAAAARGATRPQQQSQRRSPRRVRTPAHSPPKAPYRASW